MGACRAASAYLASRKLQKSCSARRSCKRKTGSPTPPTPPASRPKTPGITAEELERIAHEAGIDPNFLRRAMEKATPAEKTNTKVQLEQVFERVVEGEIEPDGGGRN